MITQGAFNLLFRSGLRKDFRDTYQSFKEQYPEYFKTGTMDGPEIEATTIAGLRRMLERQDGEAVTYEDPKLGPKVAGVDKEYALGFIITRRTVEDDKYKKANQASKWLAHAGRMTREYRGVALLDDAFVGTDFKGLDGLALCHTAHTCINSATTWANTPSSPVGFSVTGITALLNLAQLVKDENGDPMEMNIDHIIYNPLEISKAIQIFGSDKEPFTAENQDNAIKKRLPSVKQTIARYKSSTTSYFAIDSRWNDAHFLTRRPIDFDDTFDFDTDAAKYKSTQRFLVWFVSPRGWFGANPS